MNLEQHFTTDLRPFHLALSKIDFSNCHILEIGAGTGCLTRLLLESGVRKITAFEIEPGLCKIRHPSLVLREEDAMKQALIKINWDCLICTPPYQLLPRIADLLTWSGKVDAILLIPEKQIGFWQNLGFSVVDKVLGSTFEPPSKGNHFIIIRGF